MAHDLLFGKTKRDWSCGTVETSAQTQPAPGSGQPPSVSTSDKAAKVATYVALGIAGIVVYMGFTQR